MYRSYRHRFIIGIILVSALSLWIGGVSPWLQSSLFTPERQSVVVWEHDFGSGLPEGWEQVVCASETVFPSAEVCLRGAVRYDFTNEDGIAPEWTLSGTTTDQDPDLQVQLVSDKGAHLQSVEKTGDFVLHFALDKDAPYSGLILMRFPAESSIRLTKARISVQRTIGTGGQDEEVEVPQEEDSTQEEPALNSEEETATEESEDTAEDASDDSSETATGTTMTGTTLEEDEKESEEVEEKEDEVVQVGDYTLKSQPVSSGGGGGGGGGYIAPRTTTQTQGVISSDALEDIARRTLATSTEQPRTSVESVVQSQQRSVQRQFTDVESTYFGRTAIVYLSQQGVIEGYSDGSFRPFAPVNRAELAKLLVEAFPMQQDYTQTPLLLRDITQGQWFSTSIQELLSRKVVQGYPDQTFRPGNPVTRAEAVKMLLLASGTDDTTIQTKYQSWQRSGGSLGDIFIDVSGDAWYSPYLYVAHQQGLLQGKETVDGLLAAPLESLSRGEAAQFLFRLLTE